MTAVPPFVTESALDEGAFPPAVASGEPPSALDRVIASRERLRLAMQRPAPSAAKLLGRGVSGYFSRLVERLRETPGLAVLIEAVESWWSQHPLRTAGDIAAEASRTLVAPLAQRNPLLLLGGAALVGALLALTRPWRWLLKPALLAGLLPQVLSRAIRHLPVESWLSMAAALSGMGPARTRTQTAAAAAPSAAMSAIPSEHRTGRRTETGGGR